MQLFDVPIDEIDLSATEFWSAPRDYRESAFAKLRNEEPIRFFEEMDFTFVPKGPGYFALTRHDDIWHASRNPQLFCSGKGSNIADLSPELNEFFGSMIGMDDPKHFRLRSIVSKGFTPREIARIEEYVKVKARTIIDRVLNEFEGQEFDFVDAIAGKFPLQIICEMMGIPESDERQIFNWTNTILGAGDPDFTSSIEGLMEAGIGMFTYAQALGEARLASPTDDLTSVMMHAVVDGERLSSQEFGSFFILLVVAGNETTRNAITHGMVALTENQDQRAKWFGDFETHTKTAVEEIVRWATPVIHFRRTATQDTEINGFPIKQNQKVVLFYNSGNRDERIFADPFKFDISRVAQPTQIGFGAGGPHFCLGANLARREIAVMFDEIRRRAPNLQITGEPAYLQSSFINGIKRINCRIN